MTHDSESQLVRRDPCPNADCGSSDGFAVYDDGHGYCFVCEKHVQNYEEGAEAPPAPEVKHAASGLLKSVVYPAIPSRNVKASVARSHGYGKATLSGEDVQVAEYRNARGEVVAQKIKTRNKDFSIRGNAKEMGLWQQHRWRASAKCKRLLITEGETDLLAWQSLETNGDRFPAVSIPNGAAAAVKSIKKAIDFVESFDEVVICFDNDDAGREAAEKVAQELKPGKARIMQVPQGSKDICEAIQNKKHRQLLDAYWNAKVYRPDGVVGGEDILKALMNPPPPGVPYPWDGLNQKLQGLRQSELVTVTAGTGVGKSTLVGQLAHHLIKQGHRIGYISLEESLGRTAERLVSAEIGKPLHLSREGITEEQLTKTWNEVFEGRLVIFNHFGSMDAETLMRRVKFMRVAEGVEFVFVDHLSILVSGWGDGDERRLIDNVMTELRSICEQTGVGMILISHLRAPQGGEKSHEEGGRPKLNQLRGSKSISQISDAVIAIARDQQGDDPNKAELVVLKNRHIGLLGSAGTLTYNPDTGRLEENADDFGFDS